ncbi:MAG: D-alanine--D-alanine ligase [Chitinophagaceae bacterium]
MSKSMIKKGSKPVVAFLTGGYSGEAVISYQSAKTIEANLDYNQFTVYKIDITTSGWFYTAPGDEKFEIDKNDFSLTIHGIKVAFDVVLIGIHGTPGEDGKLQGYFDMLRLPYTSCSAAVSALTFNKRFTVAVAAFGGIPVSKSVHLFKEHPTDPGEILKELHLPVFVKPNNGGSSIGMSKVINIQDLPGALEKAFLEDTQVLVEEFIAGREFTIGVFRHQGTITTLPITEVISKRDFFDYEAKYVSGMSEEITPAVVDDSIAQQVRDLAKKAYSIFNCSGVVRIDFIYNEAKGLPYMLEINTVPGQSEASIVPQQVRAMGWTLTEFYTSLIKEAMAS